MKLSISVLGMISFTGGVGAAFDLSSKLTGGEGHEYEKKETNVAIKINARNCDSCAVSGGVQALFDGKTSTMFDLEAKSEMDIASNATHVDIDVKYDTRKTHLNHVSITCGDDINSDPSMILLKGRNADDEAWIDVHSETNPTWSGRKQKKDFLFNNHNSYLEHRITLMKKADSEKMVISDIDMIQKITWSLAAETYYKLMGIQLFSPSIVHPKVGFVIGTVANPSRNFVVSVKILPLGKVSGFGSIYLFRDDPMSKSNYANPGDRCPALYFYPDSYGFDASIVDKTGRKRHMSTTDYLVENVESTVIFKVIGDFFTVHVDGETIATVATNLSNRVQFEKLYAFTGVDLPYVPIGNVKLTNLRWTNVEE